MIAKLVFALFFIACFYAAPLKMATAYAAPLVVPNLVQELEEPLAQSDDLYILNSNPEVADETTASFDIEKHSVEETGDEDLDAAGTNVMRPLFVYRQQVAYRQRVRDAIRRGRRI